jgi:kynurenine formamidase
MHETVLFPVGWQNLASLEHFFPIYTLYTESRSLKCLSTQKYGGIGVDTDPTDTVSNTHLHKRGALAAFARGLAENLTL